MLWKETCAIDQKIQMIGDYLSQEYTITQLSEMYEVSRKTIYKWIGRYRLEGTSPSQTMSCLKHRPASSTAGDIRKQEGLVRFRRKKRRTSPYTQPFNEGNRPNAVWRADFKGQFRTGDGKLCYPLTISDNYRRYLLSCRGLRRPTFEESRPWFEIAYHGDFIIRRVGHNGEIRWNGEFSDVW